MSKTIATIENCVVTEDDDGHVHYIAKAAIDCDGSDNRFRDPDWQADTTLHIHGHPVDAETVPYIVVPPAIRKGVKGIVMGCRARVTNTRTGETTLAVVADIGPRLKLGELSCECARRVGLSGNPRRGGTDDHIIKYEIWPGEQVTLDGVTYDLQPA